ncbi:NAD(+) diphosphatase, partial [Salmonella enterica subsp. enterica serovar Eastbourne]|nr:NAD(+) diphosphatase [Salmonella enterica subsp. enterica serovar Eastbourne]
MQQILTGNETGYWVISADNRVWLPEGQLPEGSAAQWMLTGKPAVRIGEWQGLPVWLIREKMRSDMCSPRIIAAENDDLFKMAGRGVQLAEFYRSHRYCGYCGAAM